MSLNSHWKAEKNCKTGGDPWKNGQRGEDIGLLPATASCAISFGLSQVWVNQPGRSINIQEMATQQFNSIAISAKIIKITFSFPSIF